MGFEAVYKFNSTALTVLPRYFEGIVGGRTGVGQGQDVNIGEIMLTYVETINILLLLSSVYTLFIVAPFITSDVIIICRAEDLSFSKRRNKERERKRKGGGKCLKGKKEINQQVKGEK